MVKYLIGRNCSSLLKFLLSERDSGSPEGCSSQSTKKIQEARAPCDSHPVPVLAPHPPSKLVQVMVWGARWW